MSSKCTRLVDEAFICRMCKVKCVKNGFSFAIQRYKCKVCGKSFQQQYIYKAFDDQINEQVKSLLKESVGIRGIGRILGISPATVQRRILRIALQINKPPVLLHKSYELDEIRTYIGDKSNLAWIVYAVRKDDRSVADFKVGKRTNKTLSSVIQTLKLSAARKIYTDKLKNYASLIDQSIHCTKLRGTNYIERKNLTLRTHLKRLSRRTICYSKSMVMLAACLKIYFWG